MKSDSKKVRQAKEILVALGMPKPQQNPNAIYTFLAFANVGPRAPWARAGRVYVSAFPSFREFKKYADKIAWETEVWIADAPAHLLHFNGDRFMGPRTS